MSSLPDPVWPVIVLAIASFFDGLLCIRPVAFIARCLEGVNFPRRWWWVFTPIKLAAAAGLIIGIWLPYLGAVTSAALVLYFVIAITMHLRERDFGRNLFLNATGMLIFSTFTLVYSFIL
ncbi:DoxX family protein [Glycomyces tenuis]|uniref:DoxX family protein n=1 Tax=Glycomyces tenuis TaxID=58116 RepID=UPI0009DC19FB|nr:DoxX family protein [Glycomyces tenuis]